MTDGPDNLLSLTELTKRYGSVTVLDRCSVEIRGGEIHALLGANGAGKSTLVKIVAGLIFPSQGRMRLAGEVYSPNGKQDAESRGVQIVQQELNLIPTLTVAENMFLSRLPSWSGVVRRRELDEQARQALDRFGLQDVATDTLVGSLGVGRQQMVEIAAALDRDCRLLILDEPTAALSSAETRTLFEWLKRMRERGVGIIYISHRLEEVAEVADRTSILRDGKYVGTYATSVLSTEDMINLMSGDEPECNEFTEHESWTQEPAALRVERLSTDFLHDVSFTVHQGERLGIAGLVGSGRSELLRAIFGADVASSGQIRLGPEGKAERFRHPSQAVDAGLAMVTEDRKQNGLLLSQSIRVNTTLASMWKRFSFAGLIQPDKEDSSAANMCRSLETHCIGVEQPAGTLSGGNQQKVAVAKWLVRDADVFLFDEPTRGIDVAARRRIHRLIGSLADDGKGIVIVSSDLSELLETCDRIAVMSNGRLVEIFSRPDWSHDRIMQAAFSGYLEHATT